MPATPVNARAQPDTALARGARSAPATRVDIIAVTRDDALLEQVGLALDGETGIRLTDSVDTVVEHVDTACAQVILLDARDCPDLGSAVDQIQSLSDSCVVVVLAPDSETSDVSTAIRRSAVFAVLPIPVEPGKTSAVLEGAREEALSRSVLAAPLPSPSLKATHDMAPLPTPALPVPAAAPAAIAPPARRRPPVWLVPGGIALLVLGIAVTWFLVDRAGQHAQPAAKDVAIAPDTAGTTVSAEAERMEQGSIEELLDKAAAAFRERRYVEPASDSAFLYYRSVLAQAPDNGEAREGVQRIVAIMGERLQTALAERRFDDAATAMSQLALMRPTDPASQAAATRIVEGQIAVALEAARIDRANQLLQQATVARTLPPDRASHWREEIVRRQAGTQVNQLAGLVSARIAEGKLLEPAGDSARDYLAELTRLTPNTRTQAAASRKLGQAFLQRSQTASAQRQTAEAERWLAEARAIGVTPVTDPASAPVAATHTDTSSTPPAPSETERLARLAQQRISEGRLVDPTQDSAVFYFGALRALGPTGTETAELSRALGSRLVERTGTALAAGDLDAAQRHLAAARQLGLESKRVDALELRLAAALQPPAPDPPVPSQPAALERTYYVAPTYPRKALEKQVSGEVQVRITVDTDGRVKGATIVSSIPVGVFDQSVLAAVSRWRFKPPPADARAVDASTVTSVVFKPTQGARR